MKKILSLIVVLFFALRSFGEMEYNIDSLKSKDSVLHSFVKHWIGTKYRMGGETYNNVDCSAFSMILYRTVYNIDIPRTAREQYIFVHKIKKAQLKMGDLVFFRTKCGTTWHVGIYLSDGYFIHASGRKTGVRISSLKSTNYVREYLSGGKIKNHEQI